MEEKTCSKCKFATRLKSGGYWCRKKYYDIEGLTCFTEKSDQFADIGKKVLSEPAKMVEPVNNSYKLEECHNEVQH